jgi:hypothetical protein
MRPSETPAAQRAGELFDLMLPGTANPHTKATIRYLVQLAAAGRTEALVQAVNYWPPTQRDGAETILKRIIHSAQNEITPPFDPRDCEHALGTCHETCECHCGYCIDRMEGRI